MPFPLRKTRRSQPSDSGRNAVRRNFTGLPSEWVQLDDLARRLGRPGYAANASETIHAAVNAVLDAEAAGLLSIEGGRIWIDRPAPRGARP